MGGDDPRSLPERPPSEVEWEELLLRVEIGPRALAVAVDDAAPDDAARRALRDAIAGEAALQRALEAMSQGREVEGAAPPEPEDDDALETLRRLRARSFAMVQRRGLEVWAWRQRGGAADGATAYQLLQAAAARDGALVAALRGRSAG